MESNARGCFLRILCVEKLGYDSCTEIWSTICRGVRPRRGVAILLY